MGLSIKTIVLITIFIVLGMILAEIFFPPQAQVQSWEIDENSFPVNGSPHDRSAFLLGYAILAPSSHNSQPWKFSILDDEIKIFADRTRWLKVADTDKRELYISLGCALENLLVAAKHFGYSPQVAYFPKMDNEDLIAIVTLGSRGNISSFRNPLLFNAIQERQTNRKLYDAKPLHSEDVMSLANITNETALKLYLISDPQLKGKIKDLIIKSDVMLLSDPSYRMELGYWLAQDSSGFKGELTRMIMVFTNLSERESKNDAKLLESTPLIGVICSEKNDKESQVKAGQALEFLWLGATALGISVHPMSQTLEIPEQKAKLAELLSGSNYPQQIFRLGYAEPVKGHTSRRPLEDVLTK